MRNRAIEYLFQPEGEAREVVNSTASPGAVIRPTVDRITKRESPAMRIVIAVLIALFAIAPAAAGPGDGNCAKKTQLHTS
ncbi:hypothetical protein [Allomesorhizobium alhagi]|uniref:Uncharacterized protein n=1 Tax=Mesorhizobium alhagi CCNWXJ12-2 TaxID=1107882 RepID=H0I0Z8_9HYPH|nr:hypothetical protein [Mesorhizobium alhagi]EHK53360.1 hypothetical protein MAXJ12_30677 [Mesorhizobium alhagi CCNWXJ12-2]